MTDNERVNTDSVVMVADSIIRCNARIRNGYSPVRLAVKIMDASWEGSAATNAIAAFNELSAKYPESRYNALGNYAEFLLTQVGQGYEQTEVTNTSLADAFK